jgi:hypothetical protein
LFWLKEGANTFGSDPSCDFVLPPQAPKKAGVFTFQDGYRNGGTQGEDHP